MHLRSAFVACVASCGLAFTPVAKVCAADIYVPQAQYAPVPYVPFLGFQGFYLGGHIGGAWADFNGRNRDFFFPAAPVTAFSFSDNGLNNSTVFGGLQGGYNLQNGPWVYGLEIDIGGLGALANDRNFHIVGPAGNFADIHTSSGAGWYGDVTGRLGYSFGPTMIYAKGGFAWAAPNFSAQEVRTTGAVVTVFDNGNRNETLTGWTVGGGFEYLLSPSWSFKVEYLLFDFTDLKNTCCNDGLNSNLRLFDKDLQINTVKVGFNYFFRPAPPLK